MTMRRMKVRFPRAPKVEMMILSKTYDDDDDDGDDGDNDAG